MPESTSTNFNGPIVQNSADGIDCTSRSDPPGSFTSFGCLASYSSRAGGCIVRLPEQGAVLAPWVLVTFEGSGSIISVGNRSSTATDPQNVAVIRSFEFGYSDGMTAKIVIHDQQGGSFVRFMENMVKHFVCLREANPATVRMKIQFGWTKQGCDIPTPTARSRCYFCLSDSVETNFTDGKFIFEITGKDLCSRMFEGGAEQLYGGQGETAIPITEAITTFMTNGPPPNVGAVRFCKMEGGSCHPCEFEEGGVAGPRGSWRANGRDKLSAVMEWLRGHRTKDGKSWIPQYNSEAPNGELIFWEDRKPACRTEGDDYWDANCIGTYIVNGGKFSPVIEFNPKIRWDFGRLTSVGGNLGAKNVNGMGTDGSKNPGRECPTLGREENPGAGHIVQTTVTETQLDNHGRNAEAVQRAGDDAQMRALKILHDNIEADLTVVGDPTILPPSEAMWSKNISIILINPFYLTVSSDRCGEWIATPVCNNVLSNKAWICKSIQHRIEGGNYTTTIGVYLAAPGIDLPANSPLGGWIGGWEPPRVC